MSDSGRPVMFADCFRDISDDELIAEYERTFELPASNWRTAVVNEAVTRKLITPPHGFEDLG